MVQIWYMEKSEMYKKHQKQNQINYFLDTIKFN